LQERRKASLSFRIIRSRTHEHADPPHALALLSAGHKWPRSRRSANKCDEFTPLHVPVALCSC
jgi:hypothetical protein